MEDFLEIIKNRRSVRRYKEALPKDDLIEKILQAASWAPSGLNNQPWRFLLLKDKKKKEAIAKFTKYADIIKGAPLVILIFMDTAESYNRDKDLMAIGAFIQNILLAAFSLGLATCWLGEILNKKEEVCRFLGIDEKLELMAAVTVGLSDEGRIKSTRKPLKELKIKQDEKF